MFCHWVQPRRPIHMVQCDNLTSRNSEPQPGSGGKAPHAMIRGFLRRTSAPERALIEVRALHPGNSMKVGLFVTCLVDLMRPSIGFASLKLLESAGYDVIVPAGQTCCGQPGYNSGDRQSAQALAKKLIEEFAACDYIVVPSGSCGGMIRAHYPELLAELPEFGAAVQSIARK